MEDIVLYFSLKTNGHFFKALKSIEEKEPIDYKKYEDMKSKLKHKFKTAFELHVNKKFETVNRPPLVIYYDGNYDLVDKDAVAVITRKDEYPNIFDEEKLVNDIIENNVVAVLTYIDCFDKQFLKRFVDKGYYNLVLVANKSLDEYEDDILIQAVITSGGLVVSEIPFVEPYERMPAYMTERIACAIASNIIIADIDLGESSTTLLYDLVNQNKGMYVIPGNGMTINKECDALIGVGATPFVSMKELQDLNRKENAL